MKLVPAWQLPQHVSPEKTPPFPIGAPRAAMEIATRSKYAQNVNGGRPASGGAVASGRWHPGTCQGPYFWLFSEEKRKVMLG